MKNKKDETLHSKKPEKRPYESPRIESESLTAFGASCNGTTNGGRKETVPGPPPCNSARLKS